MKRIVFVIIGFLSVNCGYSAIITWDGEAGDGLWQNGLNWSTNSIPGENDEVLLDNSVISNSYTVSLPVTSTTIASIKISPGTGHTIILLLPPQNTILSDAFVTTGTGYVVLIDPGGMFINNATVASGTNLTISDSIRINDGGRYIHRTRSGHSAWVSRLSRISGTEKGVIEFDVPASSFLLSLSGRVYGTLVLSTNLNDGPVTYSGSGAQNCNIRGDLRLQDSSAMTLNFTVGVLNVHGAFSQSNATRFNLQTSGNNNLVCMNGNVISSGTITKTGSGIPELKFNGKQNQSIVMSGEVLGNIIVCVDNPAGITINHPLFLSYQLKLANGKIKTTSTNLLTLRDGAIVSDVSTESFIDGPLRKIGDDAFMFPVGKGQQKSPIGISSGIDPADEFIAEYFQGNPKSAFGESFETPGISHMSTLEWWELQRVSGTTSREVTLQVTSYSDATMLEHLRVMRFDGSLWKNEGNIAFTGLSFGPITSEPVSGFFSPGTATPFSIGSAVATVNPLNTEIIRFEADKISPTKIRLEWEVANIPTVEERFFIERQNNDAFHEIGVVYSNLNSKIYDFIDHNVQEGRNQYRVRFTVAGGGPGYTRTISIDRKADSFEFTRIAPYQNSISVELLSEKFQRAEILIVDMLGRILHQGNYHLTEGNNSIVLSKIQFSKGVHHLIVFPENAEKKSRSFIMYK